MTIAEEIYEKLNENPEDIYSVLKTEGIEYSKKERSGGLGTLIIRELTFKDGSNLSIEEDRYSDSIGVYL